MTEIKPVPAERFNMGYSFYDQPEMQTSETGDYVEFSAYEALQKENERLDFKFKHYCGRIRKVLQRHRERDAAQAKRIADLEETNGLLQTQVHCLEIVAASKNGDKP